jgi:predicted lipoprotein
VVNDVQALNVTTRQINMVKMGAMKSFLNRADSRLRSKTLEDCFASKWRDDSTYSKISGTIIQTYEDFVAKKVKEVVTQKAVSLALVDSLANMMDKMDI